MGRHLVLTVHGIGEQKPGETVDQVVGAATTWLDGKSQPPIEVEREMIELAERNFDDSHRNAKLFKVNLRKVSKPNDTRDQALFAEVFWADRSPAPKGAIKTAIDLIWVVLALGYLAMDNVEQTHARKGIKAGAKNSRNTYAAKIVHLFTWVFFGAVATLNSYLLIGAGAVMIRSLKTELAQGWGVLFTLLLLIYLGGTLAGYLRFKTAPTYLRRVFWCGIGWVGLILAVALISGPYGLELWALPCDKDGKGPGCGSALEQLVVFQLMILGGIWALLILLTVILYLMSMLKLEVPDSLDGHRRLYPSICAGMLVFWMFFISGLWLAFEKLLETAPSLSNPTLEGLFAGNLRNSLDTLSIAFGAIALLVALGIGLFVGRKLGKTKLHEKHDFLSRAILNQLAQAVFFIAAISLAVVAVSELSLVIFDYDLHCTTTTNAEGAAQAGKDSKACNAIGNGLSKLTVAQGWIGVIVLGATATLYRFSNVVAAGLGVARDIVTYAIRDKCALRWKLEDRRSNYPDRRAIDERFYRTLYYALDIFPADHITVISHSQGTVIATQMLADERVQKRIKGRPVTLITMGAPVTHIYQRYFPEMFTVNPKKLGAAWFNIFRQDDFVGTRIDGNLIPSDRNIDVPPGGHTGYFTDHKVWTKLTGDKIGFHLFNPKRH